MCFHSSKLIYMQVTLFCQLQATCPHERHLNSLNLIFLIRRGTDTPVHCLEKTAGSAHSSTSGLSLLEQLERQAEFHSSTQDEA